MAKTKYKFNPDLLTYYKVEKSRKQKTLNILAFFFVIILNAGIGYGIFSLLIDSPKEKGLKRQISEMNITLELFNKDLDNLESVLSEMQERDDNIYRTIFEAEPLNKSLREAGVGGSNRYSKLSINNSEIIVETAKRLDAILRKTYVQSESYDALAEMAVNKEAMIASIPAIQPISNKDLTRTASGWGYRIHPIYKITKFHYGIDFTAPTGTDVYVTGDGVVERIERSNRDGYGNNIVINHGYGFKTMYAHLDGFNVKEGQKVKRGDIIGFVGNTGLSTAPHLHYEVFRNNDKVNPVNYFFNDLTADEYNRMIELSMRPGQSFD